MANKLMRVVHDDTVSASGTVRAKVPLGDAGLATFIVVMTNADNVGDISTVKLFAADGKGIVSAIEVAPTGSALTDLTGNRAEHHIAFDVRGLMWGEVEVVSGAASDRDLEIHAITFND